MMSSIPQDLLATTGLISVNYRTLEIHLQLAIWKLLGAEKRQSVGSIVTADLTFSKLINLIGSLHQELCKDKQTREEFQKLLIEIKNISWIRQGWKSINAFY